MNELDGILKQLIKTKDKIEHDILFTKSRIHKVVCQINELKTIA